jgi:hypothetical protein
MVGSRYWAERLQEAEISLFGAPMSHDGTLPITQITFMSSLDDVGPMAWVELLQNMDIDWAVVGISKSSGTPLGGN